MKNLFVVLFFAAASLLTACNPGKSNTASNSLPLYDSSYTPGVFADPARKEKIKASFAIIDTLYRKYAEQHHLPGISFGLVADGQLVYKNSYGYTNIEKKDPGYHRIVVSNRFYE